MSYETNLAGLYISPKGFTTTPVPRVEAALEGLVGERHSGFTRKAGGREPDYTSGTLIRNNRQWSAVSTPELAEIAQLMALKHIAPEWVAANLAFLSHITQLTKGTKLIFPDRAVLVVEGENEPCTGPGGYIAKQIGMNPQILGPLFEKKAKGKRGIVGVVKHVGTIANGDVVKIEPYEPKTYSFP